MYCLCRHIQNFHFLATGKDITASLRLRSTSSTTTLTLWGHYYGKYGLSEHEHCDNTTTNSNSENARSRIVASLLWSVGTGTKEDESSTGRVWAAGFHHVTARSRLARVTELISLILQIFGGGHGWLKPWVRGFTCTHMKSYVHATSTVRWFRREFHNVVWITYLQF